MKMCDGSFEHMCIASWERRDWLLHPQRLTTELRSRLVHIEPYRSPNGSTTRLLRHPGTQFPQSAHHPVGNLTSKKLTSLSKDSSVSLTQVLVHPRNRVYLVSINSLWSSAFTTTEARAMNLQDILHPSTMPKVGFAVGESSGALFAHGDIVLDSIQDIQLVQYAARQRLQRSKRDRGRGSLEMYQTGWSDVCSRGAGLGAWARRHTPKERGFGARSLMTGVWDQRSGGLCARWFVLAGVAGPLLVVS